MKFDHHLPAAPLGEMPGRAEWAQRIGCDGVFSADTAREPFLPIALAASAAPGLDFGTAIAAAFARSPMVAAQTAWALAELTGGRFLLGLGPQIKAHVERRFAMPWVRPPPVWPSSSGRCGLYGRRGRPEGGCASGAIFIPTR